MEAIIATSKNLVIGSKGQLPWHIPRDLKHFHDLTNGHAIIMGRKTFETLPIILPERTHIVVTRTPSAFTTEKDVIFTTLQGVLDVVSKLPSSKKAYVIGGAAVLQALLPHITRIHLTLVDKTCQGETFLPSLSPHFHTETCGESFYCDLEKCNVQFLKLLPTFNHDVTSSCELAYTGLLEDVLTYGSLRSDRTGTGTVSVFGRQIRFDLRTHVPLLTTKTMAWKSCIKELLWFLRGDTDATILKQQGVGIWDGNTTRDFLDKRGLQYFPEGDIGAGYGFQWRHFGAEYGTCKDDYADEGVDQIANVIESLKTDPFGRRHVVSAWNPAALPMMALPPCHVLFQFYVDAHPDSGEKQLSCHMYQRSVDCFLGLPFNIFSYAVLTHIISLKVGMRPKELVISMGDVHIYTDHVAQVKEQLSRSPQPAPILRVNPEVRDKDLRDITIEDFELLGYLHHPPLKARMSV